MIWGCELILVGDDWAEVDDGPWVVYAFCAPSLHAFYMIHDTRLRLN